MNDPVDGIRAGSRREFILGAGIAAGGAAFLGANPAQASQEPTEKAQDPQTAAPAAEATKKRPSSIRVSPDPTIVGQNLGFLGDCMGPGRAKVSTSSPGPTNRAVPPVSRTQSDLRDAQLHPDFVVDSQPRQRRGRHRIVRVDLSPEGQRQCHRRGAAHRAGHLGAHPVEDQDSGKTQSVARMANIPHGNSLLAQGTAIKLDPFAGNPFDPSAVSLAKNTAPFTVGGPLPAPGTLGGFPPYDLSNLAPAAANFRTPAGNSPAKPLPATILGVPMQEVIIDPTKLLTAALSGQTIESLTVITVATVASLQQQQSPLLRKHRQPRPRRCLPLRQHRHSRLRRLPLMAAAGAWETSRSS